MTDGDSVSAFRLEFPSSKAFDQALALIAATHSMSFYSLTLQHGVPFQPVNIRVATDPLSLLENILDQNSKSYTHLDDLINIGRNLAIASPSAIKASMPQSTRAEFDHAALTKYAERRVIFMCISAALTAQDFDTAYSYLINRLSPSLSVNLSSQQPSTSAPKPIEDDISWRAAFLAGRYRPASSAPKPLSESIRRLEQRNELLSLALLLAPESALTEILSVYRRCEEEMASLHAQQSADDDAADAALSQGRPPPDRTSTVPGGFEALGPNEGRIYGQTRREMGRISGPVRESNRSVSQSSRHRPDEEAPVGLFDLASGAAAALRRNAFPLRGKGAAQNPGSGLRSSSAPRPTAQHQHDSGTVGQEEEDDWGADWGGGGGEDTHDAPSHDADGEDADGGEAWGWSADGEDEEPVGRTSEERVRKRDMVASAVTGSLASGIGWVLGATPAGGSNNEERRQKGGRCG